MQEGFGMDAIRLGVRQTEGRRTSFEFDVDTTRLGLEHLAITEVDLTPVQYCENLEILSFFSNYISQIDLEPISKCSKLRTLRLGINCLKDMDLTPLAECQALEWLDIGANRFTRVDLSPLEGLTRLRKVRLDGNRLAWIDLSPLESSEELEYLDLTMNELKEIDLWPLAGCLQLKKLLLWGNRFRRVDVSPLLLIGDRLDLHKDGATSIVVHPDASGFITAENSRAPTTYEFPLNNEIWQKLRGTILSFVEKNSQSRAIRFQRILLKLLGMDELGFYDGPLHDLWTGIPSDLGLAETRQTLYDRMIELLERQLENAGPTLFVDIDRLALTRGCKLIPGLLEQRSKEMDEIVVMAEGHSVDISPLWLTSYGYAVLKSLGVESTTVTSSMMARISKGLGKAGFKVRTTKTKAKIDVALKAGRRSNEILDYVLDSRETWTAESVEHLSPTRVKVNPALAPTIGPSSL
ncbi:MAG: hypothetical protein JSW05_12565 [Candidatus Thorarchaeota archaeon]|nr:MAG: hypothetical protein JSW05_12565 [Candidatus Thorarchaeota archaeon]